MTPQTTLLTLACSATAHIIMTCVIALYARHKIQYLCLAWVNGIFAFTLIGSTFFSETMTTVQPGILHPAMLLALVATCYLQSIYPLSIPMPGFLQWGRMWKYAQPAILLIVLYLIGMLLGSKPIRLDSLMDIHRNIINSDVLLRLAALGLSIYYIVNIFRLPRRMAHNANVPRYLLGYCFTLGMSVVFYTVTTIFYNPLCLMVYIVIFTLLNMYLSLRTLETMALTLPKPDIEEIAEEPSEEIVAKAEKEDFNEANQQRFMRIEFWMQNHKDEWTDYTFSRDRLCEAVGYNRHLLLQSIRSQGYNNVHEYIYTYRVHELKRLIQRGAVTSVAETIDAGFGTPKTARTTFERMEGISLDAYIERYKK